MCCPKMKGLYGLSGEHSTVGFQMQSVLRSWPGLEKKLWLGDEEGAHQVPSKVDSIGSPGQGPTLVEGHLAENKQEA